MKMLGRIWRALRFAFRALAYEWRHGPGSTLVAAVPGPEPETTLLTAPETIERPVAPPAPPPAPSVPATQHPPLDFDDIPYYYVQTYAEETAVASYAGVSGRDYRKCIEDLRVEGVTFHAWMGGAPHDWGPRNA